MERFNGNDPIHPCMLRQYGIEEFRIATEKDQREGAFLHSKFGLTIRQQFAAMAMQGLLAVTKRSDSVPYPEYFQACASVAVSHADALIAELNKPINLTDPETQSKIEREANND